MKDIYRFITSNTLVPCFLFSKFKRAKDTKEDALRVTLGWGLPSKRVSNDFDLQLILYSDTGKSLCIVKPDRSSK